MNFDTLREVLDNIHEQCCTPSVDCMVYLDHKPIFRYFRGYRNVEEGREIDGKDLYITFSVTKVVTAVAVLQLVEKGLLSLEDEVSKYLPEYASMKLSEDALDLEAGERVMVGEGFGEAKRTEGARYAKNPITVKHLLTMTSGLDYNNKADAIVRSVASGLTSTRDIVRAISESTLAFEPGERFLYGFSFDVLGAVVEVASGMRFGEYVKKYILDPCGMKETSFHMPRDEAGLSRMVHRYRRGGEGLIHQELDPVYEFGPDYDSGGAGLISTTEDFALFHDALACGGETASGARILSPESIDLMRTNCLSGVGLADFGKERPGYGYGLGVRTHMDKEISGQKSPLGEFGWSGAGGALSLIDPENRLSLTYFQQMQSWGQPLHNRIRNALYGALEEELKK